MPWGGREEAGGHPRREPECFFFPGAPEPCSVLTGATAHSPHCAAAACTNTGQMLPRMFRIRPSHLAWLPDPATARTCSHSPLPRSPLRGSCLRAFARLLPSPECPSPRPPSHTLPGPPGLPPTWAAFPARPHGHGPQCHFISSRALSILPNGSFFPASVFPQENAGSTGQGHPCVVVTAPSGQ